MVLLCNVMHAQTLNAINARIVLIEAYARTALHTFFINFHQEHVSVCRAISNPIHHVNSATQLTKAVLTAPTMMEPMELFHLIQHYLLVCNATLPLITSSKEMSVKNVTLAFALTASTSLPVPSVKLTMTTQTPKPASNVESQVASTAQPQTISTAQTVTKAWGTTKIQQLGNVVLSVEMAFS